MSISKSNIQYIKSLHHSKNRMEEGLYIIEGKKLINEWIAAGASLRYLLVANDEYDNMPSAWKLYSKVEELIAVPQYVIDKLSSLHSPSPFLAVVIRTDSHIPIEEKGIKWTIALDRVQDPGNMGTIIRIADWYGIGDIICESGTVDVYNPKVIQSSMGSILRVAIRQESLANYLANGNRPIYAAVMNGDNLYAQASDAYEPGIILLGNEANGIHPSLQPLATKDITIPRIGQAESLNVAVACGIICSHLCRLV